MPANTRAFDSVPATFSVPIPPAIAQLPPAIEPTVAVESFPPCVFTSADIVPFTFSVPIDGATISPPAHALDESVLIAAAETSEIPSPRPIVSVTAPPPSRLTSDVGCTAVAPDARFTVFTDPPIVRASTATVLPSNVFSGPVTLTSLNANGVPFGPVRWTVLAAVVPVTLTSMTSPVWVTVPVPGPEIESVARSPPDVVTVRVTFLSAPIVPKTSPGSWNVVGPAAGFTDTWSAVRPDAGESCASSVYVPAG